MRPIARFHPQTSVKDAVVALRSGSRHDDTDRAWDFEKAFASLVGRRHAVLVTEPRTALWLALRALGVGAGDDVVFPALVHPALPAMAQALGARVVFADVHPETRTLDPAALAAVLGPATKAVVASDLFGVPADWDALEASAGRVTLIEDASGSAGARFDDRPTGERGRAAVFSFQLTGALDRHLCGVLVTDDRAIAEGSREQVDRAPLAPAEDPAVMALQALAARVVSSRGLVGGVTGPLQGLGRALAPFVSEDDLLSAPVVARPRAAQGLMALHQLERLPAELGARTAHAHALLEGLKGVPDLGLPRWPAKADPAWSHFVLAHPRRDAIVAALRKEGVDAMAAPVQACTRHPRFPGSGDCPVAEAMAPQLFCLPLHGGLFEADRHALVDLVRRVLV